MANSTVHVSWGGDTVVVENCHDCPLAHQPKPGSPALVCGFDGAGASAFKDKIPQSCPLRTLTVVWRET